MLKGCSDYPTLTLERARALGSFISMPTCWQGHENLAPVVARMDYWLGYHIHIIGQGIIYAYDPAWIDSTSSLVQKLGRTNAYINAVGYRVAYVDPVNEPVTHGFTGMDQIFSACGGQWPRRVNETGILTGETTETLYQMLRFAGPLYECIGVQAHVNANYYYCWYWFTVDAMRRQLARLAELAPEMHFSEVSVPAVGQFWNPSRQASFLKRILDAGKGIVTFASYYYDPTWNPACSLWNADGTPRPALGVWQNA